jgi:membrane-bound serine protease (ClpP class)
VTEFSSIVKRPSLLAQAAIGLLLAIGCLAPAGLFAQAAGGEAARTAKALLIPIEMPLQGQSDEIAKQWLEQALTRFPENAAERPTIVIEFRTDVEKGETGQGTSFERALSLSRFLISGQLRKAKVVAYVPSPLKGHAILPVLACEQVILAPGASLSEAGIDETTISPTLVRGYREVAEARRTFPAAVAVGLLDKTQTVNRAETSNGVQYLLADELKDLQNREAVNRITTVLDSSTTTLTADDLRNKYRFASHIATSRDEIADALGLAPGDLEEDPSLVRPWKAARIRLEGPLTPRNARWTREQIEIAIQKHEMNFICLEIDSAGGDPSAALLLADYLAGLDPAKTRTVAYINGINSEARSDAGLVALACDQIMMSPKAQLGGGGTNTYDPQLIADSKPSIKAFCRNKGRDWSLALAMIDQTLDVRTYHSGDTSGARYWTDEEHSEKDEGQSWTKAEAVLVVEGFKADEAIRLGLARGIAESLSEVEQEYHLAEPMTNMRAGWAHELVQRLADPRLAGVLLFVAFFALFLEAMTPGIGLPSIVSGICFMLFFWSQFLHGTAGMLEVLLFIAGAACIAVELFFLPGFGVFGLGGILMVVSSIILASQTFIIPANAYQLRQLPTSLYMVTAALSGTAVCIFLMRKYLHNAPMIRRMMLAKEAPEVIQERRQKESFAVYDFLLNKRGTVVTPLTPAGKARFGDDLVDVVSADGDYVERQCDVYVVEVRGSRVAVRKIT